MLLDPTCAACGAPRGPVCPACAAALQPAAHLPPPVGIDAWWAVVRYEDPVPALVLRLKNGQRRDLVAWLADRAAALPVAHAGTVVTWAPTSAARRRARGYDQAELVARAVARRWGRPCRDLLLRGPGPPQAGRAAAGRREGPRFRTRRRVPPSVVLVDDVATTGATLTAAARALRGAGAREVQALVVARADAPIAAGG